MTETYEYPSEQLGNCPNCGAVVVREQRNYSLTVTYYWPCCYCGFTHYGDEIPALE